MKLRMTTHLLSLCVLASALVPLQASVFFNNGGFESGFTGWTRSDQLGGDGTFLIQSGIVSPVNGTAVPGPPSGTNAAMSDAQGPGTHVLFQDFVVTSPVTSAMLSFSWFTGNRAGSYFVPTPASLDFGAAAFNQQARVDILLGSSTAFSLAASDILLNVFQTSPGDAAVAGYTLRSADIASIVNSHLNTPLRLRFAETDNVAAFQFGVDNVSVSTTSTEAPVPEPATLAMGATGILLIVAGRRIRRTR